MFSSIDEHRVAIRSCEISESVKKPQPLAKQTAEVGDFYSQAAVLEPIRKPSETAASARAANGSWIGSKLLD